MKLPDFPDFNLILQLHTSFALMSCLSRRDAGEGRRRYTHTIFTKTKYGTMTICNKLCNFFFELMYVFCHVEHW